MNPSVIVDSFTSLFFSETRLDESLWQESLQNLKSQCLRGKKKAFVDELEKAFLDFEITDSENTRLNNFFSFGKVHDFQSYRDKWFRWATDQLHQNKKSPVNPFCQPNKVH